MQTHQICEFKIGVLQYLAYFLRRTVPLRNRFHPDYRRTDDTAAFLQRRSALHPPMPMRSIRKLSLPAIKLMQAIRYLRCRQSLDQYHIESQQLPEFPRNHDTGKAVGRVVQIVAESVLSDTEQLPNDERVASAVAPAGVAGFVKQRIDIPNDGDAVETMFVREDCAPMSERLLF